ncbi:MAG: hypothetical protein FWC41_05225 [Firmicutes bacterium]|nr:hypothetical protein [Bacillota bacterium]
MTYLLKELQAHHNITESMILDLPAYSYNLKKYYDYLITKLNTKETLPRILSGVNFYLTKEELKEITGDGDYVDDAIITLCPILRLNISQNGYIIYHESFRRYILDVLRDKNVSIEQNIFNPTIEWFKSKDLFSYAKAYRYALRFYCDCCQYENVEPFIQKDFIVNSVVWGQPWEQIEQNIHLLSRAAVRLKDLRYVIVVNELFKTIGSADNSYESSFLQYLECIGLLKGFEHVTNFLTFEGKPTVDLRQGLAACYLCANYNNSAPWDLYFAYFEKKKQIKVEDFKYFVKYYIVNEDTERIIKIASNVKRKNPELKSVLKEEIEKIPNTNYKNQLIQENPLITEIVLEKTIDTIKNIDQIIVEIKEIKGFIETANIVLNDFITQCELQIRDEATCNHIIEQLSGKNWFYNWLIYCAKIAYIRNKPDSDFEDVRQAFSYLIYDLEPFKGEPRICDLYYVEPLICKTLKNGLSFIKTFDEWEFAINILIQVSEKTTISLKGSIGGPIAVDKLFTLFYEISNPINIDYIIQKAIEIYDDDKAYRFFSYLSDYCFTITKLCYQVNRLEDANFYFQLGARYMVSYTWRRDMTLMDGIECMASLAQIDFDLSKKYLIQLKELTDSVTNHTDGKDTKWLPIYWFKEYLEIDMEESTLWLMNQLYQTRYDWRLENNLKDLIEQTRGNINPVVEQFILNSFIVDDSESYLECANQINERLNKESNELALFFAKKIHSRTEDYSSPLANIKKEVDSHSCNSYIEQYDNTENLTSFTESKENDAQVISIDNSPNFSDMSLPEIGNYVRQKKLSDSDVSSLIPIINKLSINEGSKELVKNCIIGEYRWRSDIDFNTLDKLFQDNQELSIYYNTLVFVWLVDGNGRCFSFSEKFEKAYRNDSQKTMEYFFELLPIIFTGSNRDFSSNLLNVLAKVEFNNQILKDLFFNLVESIDYKIPVVDNSDWDNDLKNEYSMNFEERLITILFIRSKAYTYDRLMNALVGFTWILYKEPDKLIKPLKWIFSKHEYFLESVLLCFLDVLADYHKTNPKYISNFKIELENLYPTRHYLIDCVLENFLNKPPYKTLIQPQLHYSYNNTATLIELNGRLQKLQMLELDASSVVAKFKLTYQSKHRELMDLYNNPVYKTMVQQIYPSNYILEIINHDLYNDLRELQKEENDDFYEYLKINTKALIAQNLSFSQRPSDLPLPSEREKGESMIPISLIDGWVRLGHFENELKRNGRDSDLTEYRCGGTFATGLTSIDRLALDCLYNPDIFCSRDDGVLLKYVEYDPIENYHLFWLNPLMMDELQINTGHFLNGLIATNEQNEVVLKCNQWRCQYTGSGKWGLQDEIPLINGMELLIREDYFNKMMSVLGKQINEYTIVFF